MAPNMTADELRAILDRIGFSQSEAGRVMGIDPRTVRRWVAGDQDIPAVAALLFRMLDECPTALRWLKKQAH